MKLKVIDRILLVIYALLVLAVLSACVAQFVFQYDVVERMKDVFHWEEWIVMTVLGVAVGVVVLLSLYWIIMAFRRGKRTDRGSVSVQNTENGAVRVSVAAMDVLVRQAIGQVEGVVNIKTHIVNHEDSITVQIDMTLTSNAHIPNVTMKMQRDIKRFIEEFAGIAVREVTIMVSDVQALPAPAAPTAENPNPSVVVVEPEKVESAGQTASEEAVQPESAVERKEASKTEEIHEAEEARVEEAPVQEEPDEPESADEAEPLEGDAPKEAEESAEESEEHAEPASDEAQV